jgi:hypothetical protein
LAISLYRERSGTGIRRKPTQSRRDARRREKWEIQRASARIEPLIPVPKVGCLPRLISQSAQARKDETTHMSGSRLIDELTCCLNQSTTTLQYCVEAEENWRNRALLHAARERHLDSVASAVESARARADG